MLKISGAVRQIQSYADNQYKELGTFPTFRTELISLPTAAHHLVSHLSERNPYLLARSPAINMFINLLSTLFLLTTLILPTYAGIVPSDFTGIGHIRVLASENWPTAKPNSSVGCLDNSGKFVANGGYKECGTFSRLADWPYTLSSAKGNCTFDDSTQEKNTDSHYGGLDHAWHCYEGHKGVSNDELYTIVRPLLSCFPFPHGIDILLDWLPIRLPLLRRYSMLL
jgi:hypothetical protein